MQPTNNQQSGLHPEPLSGGTPAPSISVTPWDSYLQVMEKRRVWKITFQSHPHREHELIEAGQHRLQQWLSQDLSYSGKTITANTKHSHFHHKLLPGWQVWQSPTNCDICLHNVFAFPPSTAMFSWHAAFSLKKEGHGFLGSIGCFIIWLPPQRHGAHLPREPEQQLHSMEEKNKFGITLLLHTQASQCFLLGSQLHWLVLKSGTQLCEAIAADLCWFTDAAAKQREGAGASHVIFKMPVTKTPLVKKKKTL